MREPTHPNQPAAGSDLNSFLAELARAAGANAARALPPVEKWNPERCVNDAGFVIRTDGVWVHEGVRITRENLVRLFATILRTDDDGQTYLVTPGEKVRVVVEDAPFLGVRVDRQGQGADQAVAITTNMADVAVIGPANPLRLVIDPRTQEPRPYVLIRGRLEARLLRAAFYELVSWGEDGPDGGFGVWSGGMFWRLG
jgi:uncharacterized protein